MNNLTKTKLGGGKTFKRFLALFLLVAGCATGAWAQDTEVAKLDFATADKKNSNYSNTWVCNGWTLYGANNNTWNYARVGGKTASQPATMTSPIVNDAVDYVEINHNGRSSTAYSISTIILETSTDNSTFTEVSSLSVTTTDISSAGTLTINIGEQIAAGNYYRIKINWANSGTSNVGLNVNSVVLKKAAPTITKEVTSIAISGTPTTTAYMVGDTPSADGLTVTATYADETTGTVSGSKLAWSFEPAVIAESTTQVTATATYDGTFTANTTFDVTVEKGIANTEETAYTVEEAVALIDANFNLDATVYVKGIISQVDSYNSTYGSITYWISEDGSTTSRQFECYSGLNIGGAKFTAKEDIAVGASVIVKGVMKKYNSTYELDKNNELVSYVVKAAESITISGSATKTEYLAGETPSAEGYTVTANYSDATSKDVTAQVAWTFTPETLAEGTTTVTATATYNGLTATTNFTATAKAVTQLIFDKTKGAFDKLSSYDKNNTTMNAVTLVDVNGTSFDGFTTNGGRTATNNGCLQLAKTNGKLVSPAFPDFTNGYTVKITYYIGGSSNPTLTSEELTATGKADGTGTIANGTGFSVELTVPTGAAFELTAGNATYISRIEITKNDAPETTTITLSEACTDGTKYYGTFSYGKSAFIVPEDLTVSRVIVDANGKLLVDDYNTGDVVGKNTGVMVSSATAGEHTVVLTTKTSETKQNMLLSSGSDGVTAGGMGTAAPGYKFYRLTMHKGNQLGFFWGAENGAAFDIAANKAYLAVPEANAANMQGFIFGDTETAIKGINANKGGKQPIYNLQGQRVSKAVKGIYIVNGKKVIIK